MKIASEFPRTNNVIASFTRYSHVQADMSSVVEEVNDKHMGPWAEACRKDGVENSPLSPYIDQELLYNKHLYLQPGKLSNSTGFTYMHPKLTKDALAEVKWMLLCARAYCVTVQVSKYLLEFFLQVLNDYVNMKIFPHSLILWSCVNERMTIGHAKRRFTSCLQGL